MNQSPHKTWVFHETIKPEGKIVLSNETKNLYKKGWVDTPAKFGKGWRSRSVNFIALIKSFLKKEWKWTLGFIVSLSALLLAYLKL